jgi:hypothetical protein
MKATMLVVLLIVNVLGQNPSALESYISLAQSSGNLAFCFVLDGSGSINQNTWASMKTAVHNIIVGSKHTIYAGIVVFSNNAEVEMQIVASYSLIEPYLSF